MALVEGKTLITIDQGDRLIDGRVVIVIDEGDNLIDGRVVIVLEEPTEPVPNEPDSGAIEMVWDYLFDAEFPGSAVVSDPAIYSAMFHVGDYTGMYKVVALPGKYTSVRVVYDHGAVFIQDHYGAAIVFMSSIGKTSTLSNPGNYSTIAEVEAAMTGRSEEISLGISKMLAWGARYLDATVKHGQFVYKVYGGYPKNPEDAVKVLADDINRALAG